MTTEIFPGRGGPSVALAESDADVRPLTDLDILESESIHIIREVVAEFDRPAMLFS